MAVTDGSGTGIHVYNYDDIYQVTEVNYPAGYEDVFTDTTYNYDAAGNRTSVIDAGGTSSYVSNALNQYTSVGGAAYVYDDSGNMTYDGDGMMYAYDPENRLTTVTKVGGPLSPGCDIVLPFASGGDAEWVLDTNEYSYDHDSARSGDIGDSQETWLQTTVTGSGTLYFDYKLSCDGGDEYAFFIDDQYKAGRAGSKDWTESGPWTITGAGTHTIRWKYRKDASGSAGSDCLWIDHIRWTGALPDAEGWDEIEYAYDPSGRRIEKKVDGSTEVKFVYDGDHIIAEYNGTGSLLRKYIHGPCIDEPICMIEASGSYAGTHYYHYDALGSVVALTDADADVVELYEYSVYGQVAASDPNHPNRFMFTGREFDKGTGLYYYRARYYHPEIGRFLQTDPIGYGDGMNWHAYCRNNSINRADPSGTSGYADREGQYGFRRNSNGPFGDTLVFWWDWGDGNEGEQEFYSIDDWLAWTFILSEEAGFTADRIKGLPGWEMVENGVTAERSRRWWWWRLTAVRLLDASGVIDGMIRVMEDKDFWPTLAVSTKDEFVDYGDAGTNILSWNPRLRVIYGGGKEWHRVHPLALLAHELSHAYDASFGYPYYNPQDPGPGEITAMTIENSVRGGLFVMDPKHSSQYPRPGYAEDHKDCGTTASNPSPTATEAWSAYKGDETGGVYPVYP